MIQECKIPSLKAISSEFCIVTVKVLNRYESSNEKGYGKYGNQV